MLSLSCFLLLLSCKANARVKLAKSGHGPHLFRIIVFCVVLVIVLRYCLYAVLLLLCCTVIVLLCYYLCCRMYWSCVLYHCHRVLTQLQSTNISIYLCTSYFLKMLTNLISSTLHSTRTLQARRDVTAQFIYLHIENISTSAVTEVNSLANASI